MTTTHDQLGLFAESGPSLQQVEAVTADVIFKQPDMLSALKLALQVSGREEKEIYLPLGIDKAQWSRILSGHAHFPINKWTQLFDLLGNEIPLIWLAYRRGKGLHVLEDAKDKTIREQAVTISTLQQEIETLIKYGVLPKAHR